MKHENESSPRIGTELNAPDDDSATTGFEGEKKTTTSTAGVLVREQEVERPTRGF